ncbi:hypothetical protein MOQ72_22230 [Saccharopolyspora sp. K220]|uniref:hypothetical protein n=1 Tax=Saccharopolyspora soli TaxID=2926618 RepID=UPI001F564741|nr:hypothetical protein [Saccharopolyspora soli]MCI2420165.1 hypothetical protein [Saccharopolyspora soli]
MRGKAWQITRAGLFLLFAVVLAVLGPVQSEAEASALSRTGAPAESNSETKERRDCEKLRERLPGIALQRRSQERRDGRRALLPRELQRVADIESQAEVGTLPDAGPTPHHCYAKLRHSPAGLQVIRR